MSSRVPSRSRVTTDRKPGSRQTTPLNLDSGDDYDSDSDSDDNFGVNTSTADSSAADSSTADPIAASTIPADTTTAKQGNSDKKDKKVIPANPIQLQQLDIARVSFGTLSSDINNLDAKPILRILKWLVKSEHVEESDRFVSDMKRLVEGSQDGLVHFLLNAQIQKLLDGIRNGAQSEYTIEFQSDYTGLIFDLIRLGHRLRKHIKQAIEQNTIEGEKQAQLADFIRLFEIDLLLYNPSPKPGGVDSFLRKLGYSETSLREIYDNKTKATAVISPEFVKLWKTDEGQDQLDLWVRELRMKFARKPVRKLLPTPTITYGRFFQQYDINKSEEIIKAILSRPDESGTKLYETLRDTVIVEGEDGKQEVYLLVPDWSSDPRSRRTKRAKVTNIPVPLGRVMKNGKPTNEFKFDVKQLKARLKNLREAGFGPWQTTSKLAPLSEEQKELQAQRIVREYLDKSGITYGTYFGGPMGLDPRLVGKLSVEPRYSFGKKKYEVFKVFTKDGHTVKRDVTNLKVPMIKATDNESYKVDIGAIVSEIEERQEKYNQNDDDNEDSEAERVRVREEELENYRADQRQKYNRREAVKDETTPVTERVDRYRADDYGKLQTIVGALGLDPGILSKAAEMPRDEARDQYIEDAIQSRLDGLDETDGMSADEIEKVRDAFGISGSLSERLTNLFEEIERIEKERDNPEYRKAVPLREREARIVTLADLDDPDYGADAEAASPFGDAYDAVDLPFENVRKKYDKCASEETNAIEKAFATQLKDAEKKLTERKNTALKRSKTKCWAQSVESDLPLTTLQKKQASERLKRMRQSEPVDYVKTEALITEQARSSGNILVDKWNGVITDPEFPSMDYSGTWNRLTLDIQRNSTPVPTIGVHYYEPTESFRPRTYWYEPTKKSDTLSRREFSKRAEADLVAKLVLDSNDERRAEHAYKEEFRQMNSEQTKQDRTVAVNSLIIMQDLCRQRERTPKGPKGYIKQEAIARQLDEQFERFQTNRVFSALLEGIARDGDPCVTVDGLIKALPIDIGGRKRRPNSKYL